MEKKLTGYTLYNEEAQKRIKHNILNELFPPLPQSRYSIIYADPPWDYNGKLQYDKSSTSKEKLNVNKKIFISSAEFKYPTIPTKELKKLDVQKISAEDCLLFMWSSSPHLQQAIELGIAWGFEYRTVAFIWDKMNHNPGKYTLSNCELCLVFKHGKIPTPRGARNIQQLVRSPRREHSVKPDEIRDSIVMMFPTQKKIELFARRKYPLWDTWGIEVDDSIVTSGIISSRTDSEQPSLF